MKRSYRRRRKGQSLPLFALMMVFVIAMVGLSVDVGNAYSQERRMQDSANAAALSGMNTVVAANNGKSVTNAQVWENIRRNVAGSRVNNGGNDYIYYVDYIVQDGVKFKTVPLADWNGYTQRITPGAPPKNIVRIQVRMEHRIPTYFTRVVGWNEFKVRVPGSACLGGYGIGVLPIGLPQQLQKTFDNKNYHTILDASGKTLAQSDDRWGKWDSMTDMTIRFPMQNGTTSTAPKTLTPMLAWSSTNKNLKASITYPGTLHEGFVESIPIDTTYPNTAPFGKLTLGDWVNGNTNATSTFASQIFAPLNWLKSDQIEFALPLYDREDTQPAFRIVRMGRFKLVNFDVTGNTPYIQVKYLGDRTYAPSECVEPPPPPNPEPHVIQGQALYNHVWGERPPASTTYDVIIVMDTSLSMSWDWNDREKGDAGYSGQRIEDAKSAIINFVQNWDVESDPDARIAFVNFGDSATNALHPVVWSTSGCERDDDDDDDDDDDKEKCKPKDKWKDIQSKASKMKPSGLTAGPLAFEMVEDLLKQKRTPRSGQKYGQIVLFATDGVFNVCGTRNPGLNPCPKGSLVGGSDEALYSPDFNIQHGRPIWQAQQMATAIKATGARIFIVALTPSCDPSKSKRCFSPKGLPEMSSGSPGYYYLANNAASLATIYDTVREKIEDEGCRPDEEVIVAPRAKVVLRKPNNPTWSKTVTADANGNFRFDNLREGQYTITVEPSFVATSGKDGKTRTYSRVVNTRNPSEEGQASIDINARRPSGATWTNDLLLTMPYDKDGGLENGCTGSTP